MNVAKIISTVRALIKDYTDDTKYGDEKLWNLYCISFADVLVNKIKKFQYVSQQLYKTVCLELEEVEAHECGCITLNCTVMRTKHVIPSYLSGRNKSTLTVLPLYFNGVKTKEVSEEEYSFFKDDDIYKNYCLYTIKNGRIILFNKDWKYLQAQAIFADITSLEKVKACVTETDCVDYYSVDTGHDYDLIDDVVNLMINKFSFTERITEDSTNDTNTDIKQ